MECLEKNGKDNGKNNSTWELERGEGQGELLSRKGGLAGSYCKQSSKP